jgi:ABC-2 type transport system permease protein
MKTNLNAFTELLKVNLKMSYRDKAGFFWTLAMPIFIYVALSLLPIERFTGAQNYPSFLLPGILAMVIMQGGIYGLTYWFVDLKAKGVVKRLTVAPISKPLLVLSVLISRLIVMLMQVVVITLVGITFFHASFHGNPLVVFLLVILGGGIFLLTGLIIGTMANTYQAAAPLTTAIGLPLTFLGNIFYSTDILPKSLQYVAKILPIVYLAGGLRSQYLGTPDGHLLTSILILLIWFVAILLITLWRFRLDP